MKQTETRAHKKLGPGKSSNFQRDIDGLYTEATLISDEIGRNDEEGAIVDESAVHSKFLFCICENVPRPNVQDTTGDELMADADADDIAVDEKSEFFSFFQEDLFLGSKIQELNKKNRCALGDYGN